MPKLTAWALFENSVPVFRWIYLTHKEAVDAQRMKIKKEARELYPIKPVTITWEEEG